MLADSEIYENILKKNKLACSYHDVAALTAFLSAKTNHSIKEALNIDDNVANRLQPVILQRVIESAKKIDYQTAKKSLCIIKDFIDLQIARNNDKDKKDNKTESAYARKNKLKERKILVPNSQEYFSVNVPLVIYISKLSEVGVGLFTNKLQSFLDIIMDRLIESHPEPDTRCMLAWDDECGLKLQRPKNPNYVEAPMDWVAIECNKNPMDKYASNVRKNNVISGIIVQNLAAKTTQLPKNISSKMSAKSLSKQTSCWDERASKKFDYFVSISKALCAPLVAFIFEGQVPSKNVKYMIGVESKSTFLRFTCDAEDEVGFYTTDGKFISI